MRLLGIDFTCAPTRRKPITVALGQVAPGDEAAVQLLQLQRLPSLTEFEALLATPGPWLAGCDFPFGLPSEFVRAQRLGADCDAVIAEVRRRHPTRMQWRAAIDAWGQTRPAGQRLLHRRTDLLGPGLSTTSPLQTRYVPVGFMYYEGLARLVAADVTLPGQRRGDPQRVALEAYPGALAHALIGRRSYKNDDSAERRRARAEMLRRLEGGAAAPVPRLQLAAAQRRELLADAGGDLLDAVLALLQAAWARPRPRYGQPDRIDAVEGWIIGA